MTQRDKDFIFAQRLVRGMETAFGDVLSFAEIVEELLNKGWTHERAVATARRFQFD